MIGTKDQSNFCCLSSLNKMERLPKILFVVVIGAIGSGTLTLTGDATSAKDIKLYRNVVKTAVK